MADNDNVSKATNPYLYASQSLKNQQLINYACLSNAYTVTLLLEAGADVNAVTSSGDTALRLAAANGFFEIANILIGAGANLQIKNNWGETALSSAIAKNHTPIATLLFSVMTQNQVDDEIYNQRARKIFNKGFARKIQTGLEKFKKEVVVHRMAIFKKLGPLFLDQKNIFSLLPIDVSKIIFSNYCTFENTEAWQDYHAPLDIAKIFEALNKNGPLTFSSNSPSIKQKLSSEEGGCLEKAMSKLKLSSNAQPRNKKNKLHCFTS